MKILVCVKQVPDIDHVIVKTGQDGAVSVDGFSGYRINRFDEFAVEEAIRIKAAMDNVTIDVLTVGPPRAGEVLKRACGMGADRSVHINAQPDPYVSPFTTARAIADYARGKSYSLILTGTMSEDMMNGQVGPMVAAFLDLPCATQVISQGFVPAPPRRGADAPDKTDKTEEMNKTVEIDKSDKPDAIDVEREIEGGSREMLRIGLPAVLAVQTGINEPRYPALSSLLRANKQKAEAIDANVPEAGRKNPDDMVGMAVPEKRRAGFCLEGSAAEKAEALLSMLRDKGILS